MDSPTVEFNYDISCPFAYIASTRVKALAERANAKLIYRPVLLGALYKATNAPQGAGGSASDVFNPTKKAVVGESMQRTLKRYKVQYNPPPQHPRKTVNALRLLYCLDDEEERRVLSEALFNAYWVEGLDVSDDDVLLQIVRDSGVNNASSLSKASFDDTNARKELESATAEALERGAFGVPGFWIPDVAWTDFTGKSREGRYFWGQDRMHFAEATLLSLQSNKRLWSSVPGVRSLMPRCVARNTLNAPTKVELWFDFSSPWSFIAYTQLGRLQRTFPGLEISMKPFLLGVLFRDIGVPMIPMSAVSKQKARWSRQDLVDWSDYWNAVNTQESKKDEIFKFYWTDHFPLRSPTVLRVAIVEPKTTTLLYSACWEHNMNVSEEAILSQVLAQGGYNATDLIARAKAPETSARLRELTAEAKANGLCGAPTYRVLKQKGGKEWKQVGGLIWGQDQINVVEDLVAGWEPETGNTLAEPRKVEYMDPKVGSKL